MLQVKFNFSEIKFSPNCYDSDAGSNAFFTKGYTFETNGTQNITNYDFCVSNKPNEGVEFFCDGQHSKTTNFDCSQLGNYVCSDGHCIQATHTICSLRKACVSILGPGTDECVTSSDCFSDLDTTSLS